MHGRRATTTIYRVFGCQPYNGLSRHSCPTVATTALLTAATRRPLLSPLTRVMHQLPPLGHSTGHQLQRLQQKPAHPYNQCAALWPSWTQHRPQPLISAAAPSSSLHKITKANQRTIRATRPPSLYIINRWGFMRMVKCPLPLPAVKLRKDGQASPAVACGLAR